MSDPQGMAETFQAWLGAHAGVAAETGRGSGAKPGQAGADAGDCFLFLPQRPAAFLTNCATCWCASSDHGQTDNSPPQAAPRAPWSMASCSPRWRKASLPGWATGVAGLGSPVTLGALTALVALIPLCHPCGLGRRRGLAVVPGRAWSGHRHLDLGRGGGEPAGQFSAPLVHQQRRDNSPSCWCCSACWAALLPLAWWGCSPGPSSWPSPGRYGANGWSIWTKRTQRQPGHKTPAPAQNAACP